MLTDRFEKALLFAARAHAKQTRKGGAIPYLAHLMSVAALVLENGGDEDQAIAALLHDVVEDQGGAPMFEGIKAEFGPRVAEIVQGCSDTDQSPKPPWLARKLAYIDHIAHAAPEVRRVSLADKVHNARDILAGYRQHGMSVFDRFRGPPRGTIWYYRAVADALHRAQPPVAPALAHELERCVAELERLTGIDGRAVGHENF